MLLAIKQYFSLAFFGLLNNKLRSFLTMLGIIIGVAAVIIIMSLGAGAQSFVLSQIKSLGTNLVAVIPGKAEDKGPPATVMGVVITTLTYEDALAIKERVPYVVDVDPYAKGVFPVSWQSTSFNANISGVAPGYLTVEDVALAKGRFFTDKENKALKRVAVLGWDIKKDLFGDRPAIGQKIKIKRQSFEVIGVMEKRGTVLFQDYDNQIFVPILTAQKLLLGIHHIGFMRIKIDQKEHIPVATQEIASLLRERHNIADKSGDSDDFTIRNSEEAIQIISTVTDSLNLFLAAVAALSLLVGGIGIMNIMIISVNERTREIGLRKALGATNGDILLQILGESVFLTIIGGLIGIGAGIVISYVISWVIGQLGYSWVFVISPLSIGLGISVAALVGMFFGLYPARRAARLSPMEALRYE